jgi:hypothetical protein
MKSATPRSEIGAWRELSEFPGTAMVKVLREDSRTGARTMLVRLGRGDQISPDVHPADVQVLLLDGECDIAGRVHCEGSFCVLPGEAEELRIRSDTGAEILLVFDPVRT